MASGGTPRPFATLRSYSGGSRHQRADILTKVFKVCVKTHEDLYGNPVTLTQQSKKEVFRADERVAQIQSLAEG